MLSKEQEGPLSAEKLATFRDGRGYPVVQRPSRLVPSATVIVCERFQGLPARLAWPCCVLVHQRADNAWWGFPGGQQEIGESIMHCAVRECYEETGLTVALVRLVCVDSDPTLGAIVAYPDQVIHYTNVTFLAYVLHGTLHGSAESLQLQWVSSQNLPTPFLLSHAWRLAQAQHDRGMVPVR